MTTTDTTTGTHLSQERQDLLETLAKHRYFLTVPLRGVTDEQAALRTTVSAFTLGTLVQHVAQTEHAWVSFALGGAEAMAADADPDDIWSAHGMPPFGTVADELARYEEVARRTSEVVATVPDLDASHPLPEAPWFEPGARWSVRRVLLHLIAETAQHAGHADIIRESLDGAKSMG